MNKQLFRQFLGNKKVAILGFGQEGRSTRSRLRSFLPELEIAVCDLDPDITNHLSTAEQNDPNTTWYTGPDYLRGMDDAGIIIKSPGIPFKVLEPAHKNKPVTSQTELFVRLYRQQITGITGTKGKSTTASLLHHIYEQSGRHSLLLGNIGVPPFDMIDQIRPDTSIIYEMSSHQLEHILVSPRYAIMLNIFPEHLDHYATYEHYRQAKLNISKWQTESDLLVYNATNEDLKQLIMNHPIKSRKMAIQETTTDNESIRIHHDDLYVFHQGKQHLFKGLFSGNKLAGIHNRINIAAATTLAWSAGLDQHGIRQAVKSFRGLPHRLELIGSAGNTRFVNDSISTIPESTIAAIEAFPDTTTVILGGYDRGVDYHRLIKFLGQSTPAHIIFTGTAGLRMYQMALQNDSLHQKHCHFAERFDDAVLMAIDTVHEGGTCLLSPAAASYDSFKNFKERGDRFRQLVQNWLSQQPSQP